MDAAQPRSSGLVWSRLSAFRALLVTIHAAIGYPPVRPVTKPLPSKFVVKSSVAADFAGVHSIALQALSGGLEVQYI